MIGGAPIHDSSAPVSVVIPCYSCSDVLDRAVASVLAQSLAPAEIILVDDASPDDGATRNCITSIVTQFDGKNGIRLLPLFLVENVGPGGARNAGWALAREKYVAFLDADDSWHPLKVATQYAWMERNPEFDLSGHSSLLVDGVTPASWSGTAVLAAAPIRLRGMLFRNRVLTRTVMLRAALTERFDEHLRLSEDYELWMRMLARGRRLAYLEIPLAYSHRENFSAGGESGRLWAMEKAELSVYRKLAQDRSITWPLAGIAIGISAAKYARRMLISFLRRVRAAAL